MEDGQRKAKVLLVDDDPFYANNLAVYLEHKGCRIQIALNGQQALEKFREARTHQDPFDLIFLDYNLKNELGTEVSQKLLEIDSSIKIVLCSGNLPEEIERSPQEFGFQSFVLKPKLYEKLDDLIEKSLK